MDLRTSTHESMVAELLQRAGVPFAFVHGSRADGTHRAGSDLDVAAWLGASVDELELRGQLPDDVDLLVLELARLLRRTSDEGFRILVHRYAEVDDGLVVAQLDHLAVLETFVRQVTAR